MVQTWQQVDASELLAHRIRPIKSFSCRPSEQHCTDGAKISAPTSPPPELLGGTVVSAGGDSVVLTVSTTVGDAVGGSEVGGSVRGTVAETVGPGVGSSVVGGDEMG